MCENFLETAPQRFKNFLSSERQKILHIEKNQRKGCRLKFRVVGYIGGLFRSSLFIFSKKRRAKYAIRKNSEKESGAIRRSGSASERPAFRRGFAGDFYNPLTG